MFRFVLAFLVAAGGDFWSVLSANDGGGIWDLDGNPVPNSDGIWDPNGKP